MAASTLMASSRLLVAGVHGHHGGQRIHHVVEREVDRRQFQLARLDLGKVQHVVEDAQQRLAGHAHHVQVFALLRRQLVLPSR
jgi:hypothetical protein